MSKSHNAKRSLQVHPIAPLHEIAGFEDVGQRFPSLTAIWENVFETYLGCSLNSLSLVPVCHFLVERVQYHGCSTSIQEWNCTNHVWYIRMSRYQSIESLCGPKRVFNDRGATWQANILLMWVLRQFHVLLHSFVDWRSHNVFWFFPF